MVATYIKKNHAQYDFCDSCVYSRNIITLFWASLVSGLVENLTSGIFSDVIKMIKVKLCMMVLLIELYLFIPLSVTLTLFQGGLSNSDKQL